MPVVAFLAFVAMAKSVAKSVAKAGCGEKGGIYPPPKSRNLHNPLSFVKPVASPPHPPRSIFHPHPKLPPTLSKHLIHKRPPKNPSSPNSANSTPAQAASRNPGTKCSKPSNPPPAPPTSSLSARSPIEAMQKCPGHLRIYAWILRRVLIRLFPSIFRDPDPGGKRGGFAGGAFAVVLKPSKSLS